MESFAHQGLVVVFRPKEFLLLSEFFELVDHDLFPKLALALNLVELLLQLFLCSIHAVTNVLVVFENLGQLVFFSLLFLYQLIALFYCFFSLLDPLESILLKLLELLLQLLAQLALNLALRHRELRIILRDSRLVYYLGGI